MSTKIKCKDTEDFNTKRQKNFFSFFYCHFTTFADICKLKRCNGIFFAKHSNVQIRKSQNHIIINKQLQKK